jgi:biopolymer transport protein ExbB
MFVSPIPPRSRRSRFRLPPTLIGALAVLTTAALALAQARTDNPAPAATAPAVNAAAATPTAAPAAESSEMSLWELHNKGKPWIYALDACSVLAVAIILERLFSLRKGKVLPSSFLAGLRAVYRDPTRDRLQAIAYAESDGSAMGRMVAAYFKRLPHGVPAAEKAMEDTGANEALRLRTNLRVFYAIGSAATLIGLLGTIAGMIRAFQTTAKAGDAANKVELLSTGIYEAMVCTFGGLAVAILVTIFYYYFVGRAEKLVTDMNEEVGRFGEEFGASPVPPLVAPVMPVSPAAPPRADVAPAMA